LRTEPVEIDDRFFPLKNCSAVPLHIDEVSKIAVYRWKYGTDDAGLMLAARSPTVTFVAARERPEIVL
jgi:hypothetical protein